MSHRRPQEHAKSRAPVTWRRPRWEGVLEESKLRLDGMSSEAVRSNLIPRQQPSKLGDARCPHLEGFASMLPAPPPSGTLLFGGMVASRGGGEEPAFRLGQEPSARALCASRYRHFAAGAQRI